jgi:hypothetical protein
MKCDLKLLGVTLLTSALLLPAGVALAASAPAAGGADPGSRYDGVYSGTTRLVAGDATQCQPGGTASVTVANDRFHFAWRPRQDAIVPISAAGGYSAYLRGNAVSADKHMALLPRIDGYANGRVLAGSYGTRWCTYSYQFERN